MTKYRCKHCGKVVHRESKKQWIKSWCDAKGQAKGQYTRLVRVKP